MNIFKKFSKVFLLENPDISLFSFFYLFMTKIYFDLIFIYINTNINTKHIINQDANNLQKNEEKSK